ncbi:MAG TPA: SPFH domain-containing protein, partial [Phycisphaerales bacterium]|nr:SPFH domain-containing protein [Phycisphaerales bacterium]
YKYFLPAVSVVVGIGLVWVGIVRFLSVRDAMFVAENPAPLGPPDGWAFGIGLILGVVGFLFARYVSGLAKQTAWANLRGGAAYSAVASVLGMAMAIAHFVDFAGPSVVREYLPIVLPAVMVVLGIEVFLNFILDLYRPRKPGEIARPAFDSRILAFIAAPDRIAQSISEAINYQLGFEVSSSWFYQLLARRIVLLVVMAVVVVWGLSAFSVVQPDQRAMVLRFGRYNRELEPGLNVKFPWPIERVEVPEYSRKLPDRPREILGYTATGIRVLDLGSPPPANNAPAILWTNDHIGQEMFQIVQPSRLESARGLGDRQEGASRASSGVALVSVEIPMYYAVRDVKKFDSFSAPEMREDLLVAVARREIMQFLSQHSVDEVVGGNREELNKEIRRVVQAGFDRLNPGPDGTPQGTGIDVLFVGVTNAHPDKAVASSFEKVVQADRRTEARIESARKDSIETLTKVVGSTELAIEISARIQELETLQRDAARASEAKDKELAVQALLEKAGGSAAAMISKAKADRWTRHMGDRGRAARYNGQIAAFEAAPEVFKAGEYFDALRAALGKSRVYIVGDKVDDLRLDIELKDVDTGVGTFRPKTDSPADY